jgi:hypothetical protein
LLAIKLRIKKLRSEVNISNLDHYSALCCWNDKCTMVYYDSTCEIIGLNLIYIQYSKALHIFGLNSLTFIWMKKEQLAMIAMILNGKT